LFSLATVTGFTHALLAQAAPAAPATQPSGPWFADLFRSPMTPLIGVVLLMYLFMISSKRKAAKQKNDLLGAIKRGDRVQTIGGIIGTVVEARDNEVLVKVDETNNTKIKFSRKAIQRVLEDDAAAEKDKEKK